MKVNSIDIFCEIIDNYGDIGVVYRISKELKKLFRDAKIRIVLNRLAEFKAINKEVKDLEYQEVNGLICVTKNYVENNMDSFGVADLFIEAFGCEVPEEYVNLAKKKSKLWINLEYLSGEKWIEDFHLQESLIGSDTLKKIFYMPGFSKKSGGVIIDSGFLERIQKGMKQREAILSHHFPNFDFKNKFIGTIFSYEKNFDNLLKTLENKENTVLILMGEKTQESFEKILRKKGIENFGNWIKYGKIDIMRADFLSQEEYEEIISAVDFNFTRGEDSFVRSILLGKPFMWHIYLQEDKAHMDKINAFVDRFKESVIESGIDKEKEEVLEKYSQLLIDYNDRDENSLKIGKENYQVFFDNFNDIQLISAIYSEFLLENCNLVKKLYKYIKDF